jgi:glutamate synthase domain-containing protein 1
MFLLMQSQQKGHDNSGFAMVMQDLGGIFEEYKELPTLSLACTVEGLKIAEDALRSAGFQAVLKWVPETDNRPGLDIQAMPVYAFETLSYPPEYRDAGVEEKGNLLVDMRLRLRRLLEAENQGFVYSFWPDVVTLKEIGNPKDIATYFKLGKEDPRFTARLITVQCRQNTNYDIVRYAAHPFFLQGYTVLANGENTFYQKNVEFQRKLHRGYIGFESDSQCFLYTLHYVHHELKWPLNYYKHVITPLPFEEIVRRPDKEFLFSIRQSLAHLEINGPNTIIGVLPDKTLFTCCDAKKLRPVVVGRNDDMVIISSEVCGLNEVLPERNWMEDIYPGERETLVVNQNLEIQRWKQ